MEARIQLLRRGRAAEHVSALQHEHAPPRPGEVRGADESVVTAADDDGIPRLSHHAFFRGEGEMIDLHVNDGLWSGAQDINDRRLVVGSAADEEGVEKPFAWNLSDNMSMRMETLADDPQSSPPADLSAAQPQ